MRLGLGLGLKFNAHTKKNQLRKADADFQLSFIQRQRKNARFDRNWKLKGNRKKQGISPIQ